MQVLPDAIIINVSPAQKAILRDPHHSQFVEKMIVDVEKWQRPKIMVSDISSVIQGLESLKNVVAQNPEYADRQPIEVIDNIIYHINDAAEVQRRTYGS